MMDYEKRINKKYGLAILVVLIIALLAVSLSYFAFTGYSINNQEGDIKIGFISSLSGDAGVWGQSFQKGFDFAVKEINDRGGINGKKIKVIYEDDACDATTGIKAFNKVIDVDNVKIITGTVCSSVAMSVAKETQENNVFYMASGATHPEVPKQGDLIFRVWVSDAYEAKELARYAINDLNFKKIAIAYFNDNPAGLELKDNFKETVEANGGEITKIEAYSSNERDFKTSLTKLMQGNPDAIYIAAIPEQTPLLVNKARELGYKGAILLYGPSVLSEGIPEKISNKGKIYYASPILKQETDFWEEYKDKTGTDADLLIAGGYDSMKIIEYGLRKCGEDNYCIRDALLNLRNYPITRGTISYDQDGDLTGVEFEIKSL